MSISPERCHHLFQKTERSLLKLSSSQQADRVHSFRTTARRLQTLLEEVIPERSRNQKKLLKLLDQIRKRAGKVRDLDVQLAALRSFKIAQEPRRKTQLTQGLIELRAKHEKRLRKILQKDAICGIRKRLRRALKELRVKTGSDPLLAARGMLAQARGPEAKLTEDVLHRYRVAVKRARYAAEFAPRSAEATEFLAQLKRLQDVIGDWHDWLTLKESAVASLGNVNESSLVAALHNVTGGKFRRAVAEVSALQTKPVPELVPAGPSKGPHRLSGAAAPGKEQTDSAA